MSGRMVVMPSRSGILCRSISYGAGWGAGIGAIVSAVPVAFFAPLALVVVPEIGAAIGAIAGAACGFTGGLGLVLFRRQASVSRAVVCLVAGAGAALLPATWLALVISPARPSAPALFTLTAIVFALAAALGPLAFYGRPPRRARRAGGANPMRP